MRSGKIDYLDVMNVELFSSFERPIVGIVSTHASIDDLSKNIPFYKVLAKFLYDGGVSKHPDFDYAIINGLEITDVANDFQLSTFYPNREFFLVILKDIDTGYIIIRENQDMPKVQTADSIDKFIQQYSQNELKIYLKTETKDTKLVYSDGVLQVYGSNFISIVKERKFLEKNPHKALCLMFTKEDCPKCDWNEAFFDMLA